MTSADLVVWVGFVALGGLLGYQLGQIKAALRLLRPGQTYRAWGLEVHLPADPK